MLKRTATAAAAGLLTLGFSAAGQAPVSAVGIHPLDVSWAPTASTPGVLDLAGFGFGAVLDVIPNADGTMFVRFSGLPDAGVSSVRKIDSSGTLIAAFGEGGAIARRGIYDIAPAAGGGLFVSSTVGVERFTPAGLAAPGFMTVSGLGWDGFPDSHFWITADRVGRLLTVVLHRGDAAINRYLSDGTVDESFGGVPLPGTQRLNTNSGPLLAMSDGTIVLATVGATNDGTQGTRLIVTRFDADGRPLPTFGTGGVVSVDPTPGVDDRLLDVREDSAGRIVVAGSGGRYLLRINSDGTIDNAYLANSITALSSFDIFGMTGFSFDRTGRAFVVGKTQIRILTAQGEVDRGFGWPTPDAGRIELAAPPESKLPESALTFDAAGRVLVWSGWNGAWITRLHPPAPVDRTPGFNSMAPRRILDTRVGLGAEQGKTGTGRNRRNISLRFPDAGGLPRAGVTAVTMNVTVVDPEADGYATVFPCDSAVPTVSNINYQRGRNVANLVTVTVPASGTVCLTSSASVHLLADLAGWYASTGAGFNPVTPERILDTRLAVGALAGRRGSGTVLALSVAGVGGIPSAGASAVTMNVTVVDPDGDGYATVFPCGGTTPSVSNLNFVHAQNVANLVTVPIADDGTVCLTSSAATHLLADVAGWFGPTGAGLNAVDPDRILDTRNGLGASAGKRTAGSVLVLRVTGTPRVPSSGVGAVTMNVTVVDPDTDGFATVYPCGGAPPIISNVNYARAQNVANLVTVPLSADGTVCLMSSATTHLLADVAGWIPKT